MHWQALKRVLCFVKGILDHGIYIQRTSRLAIFGYLDVNHACSQDDRRSVSGYCVYLGDNLVSWSSKKPQVVSQSSAESEYRALAHIIAEIMWI